MERDGRVIVLSIGTSHPWNVAGTGRDLVIGTRLHARVFTVIAAVSAQDARGVVALQAVEAAVVRAELDALPWNSAGAVRIGALPTAENVRTVAQRVREYPGLPAIVDPAFAASRGGELGDAAARTAVRDELATLSNVVLTPNVDEAAALLGRAIARETVGDAARELQRRGALAVLLKGGHLDGDPVDALATERGVGEFTQTRIAGTMHGLGCTLAMALACELAAGASLDAAVASARSFVRAELARH